jgi:hypothetical protein
MISYPVILFGRSVQPECEAGEEAKEKRERTLFVKPHESKTEGHFVLCMRSMPAGVSSGAAAPAAASKRGTQPASLTGTDSNPP